MARLRVTPRQRVFAIMTAALLAASLLALSIYFGVAAARGRRARRSRLPKIAPVLLRSEFAFNVNDNVEICKRATKHVPRTPLARDHAERINSAMRDLSAKGGGTVSLDSGVYELAVQLWVPTNICLRGRGMLETILRMQKRSAPFEVAGMLRVENATRISLLDFTLDGARDTQRNKTKKERYGRYGLYATEFSHMWLRKVRAVNHLEYGFDPHGTRETWSHYLVMEGCVAERNGLDGFTLDQTRHISLLDSIARDNVRHGVNIVTGSSDVLVKRMSASNNGADSNVGCGIIAQNNDGKLQTRDIVLDYNTVSESPRGGVCISETINVTISNTRATITRFSDTPCYVLRRSVDVVLHNSSCVASSLHRLSNRGSTFEDDRREEVEAPARTPSTFTDEGAADPLCTLGVHSKDVCCPAACRRCGGPSCGTMKELCCMSQIRDSGANCNLVGAPCILHPDNVPVPDVDIDIPVAVPPGSLLSMDVVPMQSGIPEESVL